MNPRENVRTSPFVAADFETRRNAARKNLDELEARSHRIGNLRGIAFLALVLGLGAWFADGSSLALGIGALGFVGFVALVVLHGRVSESAEGAQRLLLVCEQALLRPTARFVELPATGARFTRADHPYAADLDLFGPGSLFQKLSTAHTRMGQERLSELLAAFGTVEDALARQSAVEELSRAVDFRVAFEAEALALTEVRRQGRVVAVDTPDPEPLLRFIEGRDGLLERPLVRLLAWTLPPTTLGLALLHAFVPGFAFLWLAPWLAGVLLLTRTSRATTDAFTAVSITEGAFLRYGKLLELLEDFPAGTPLTRSLREQLSSTTGERTSALLGRFQSIVGTFELRHSGMVYPVVNSLFLWDVHCTLALERWRRPIGARARDWFRVIGEFEALASLSTLRHDEPDSTFPEFSRDGEGLCAIDLGHPLIERERRVENSLDELAPGTGLLVTGSNMSGKSTFLRSLGTNLVLAYAGGPVLARRLLVPVCRLGCSLRISDSLQSGVSHFYAEVRKLAQVVALHDETRPVFFLLDEVLHGTNSRERTIGARWVIETLLERGALGIVTTHDEKLAELSPSLAERVRQFHFEEQVEDGAMTFDYRLRPGPVKSGNALRLMRLVGLDVPLE